MASFFNEICPDENALIWKMFEMFYEVCETRCKYKAQLNEISHKQTLAEESGDDEAAEKCENEWDALEEKYCQTCPLYLIAIGGKGGK